MTSSTRGGPARRPNSMRLVLAAAMLLPTCTGCLTTEMWANASKSQICFAGVLGVTDVSDGAPCLIAQYGLGATARLVRVPLDPTGRPAAPFAWIGPVVPIHQGLLNLVTDDQRRQLDAAAVPLEPDAKGLGRLDTAAVPLVEAISDETVVLIAYRKSSDGRLEQVTAFPATEGSRPWCPFPPGVSVVVLPNVRTFDPHQRRFRQAEAVAMTPLTAGVDTAAGIAVATSVVTLFGAYLYLSDLAHSGR
jgi:hypothetical protein